MYHERALGGCSSSYYGYYTPQAHRNKLREEPGSSPSN